MPSVLYSTTCYIKNDSYRLSIYTDDDERNANNVQFDTDSSDFTSPDIPIDTIIPSLTGVNFELINKKKDTNIPKTIILNHLISVQQTQTIPNRNRKNFSDSYEVININDTTTPIIEQSLQTSYTTLNTNISEFLAPTTPQQSGFGKLLSTQSFTCSETNSIFKTIVNINYVDISNSIRWNIKTLKLEFETEDIANELYANLNLCLSLLKQRPSHLLAFVNPFGGKGKKKSRFLFS